MDPGTLGGVVKRMQLLGSRYRLAEPLGSGGMSVVWRGYDELLGRLVAIKVLAITSGDVESYSGRTRQEAMASARISHPNIAGVYDYGEVTEPGGTRVPYMVMELVEGRSLTPPAGRGPAALAPGGPRVRGGGGGARGRARDGSRAPGHQPRQRVAGAHRREGHRLRHLRPGRRARGEDHAAGHAGLHLAGALRVGRQGASGRRRVRARRAAVPGAVRCAALAGGEHLATAVAAALCATGSAAAGTGAAGRDGGGDRALP